MTQEELNQIRERWTIERTALKPWNLGRPELVQSTCDARTDIPALLDEIERLKVTLHDEKVVTDHYMTSASVLRDEVARLRGAIAEVIRSLRACDLPSPANVLEEYLK